MLIPLVILSLTALNPQQQCLAAHFLNKRGTAFYCDFLGQRSFYA